VIERGIDARLFFLLFLAVGVVFAVIAVRTLGMHLRWNTVSFVPVAAAVVVLILARRWLRRFLPTTQLESVWDVQNVSVIVFGERLAPAFAASAAGLLVAQFTGVSAVLVGSACALIPYVRAWPGART
jgi:hypothetical protein